MSAATQTAPAETFALPADLEAEINELVTHYPEKRSASLMLLHAVQERLGHITPAAEEWIAAKLGLQPINVHELVTFYPMFRQKAIGRTHLRICRTLSCALVGAGELHGRLCKKLGLDSHAHGLQTSADGEFTVEYVECLASCGTAPVMMVGDTLHERVTPEQAEKLTGKTK